jgi:carboxyl-terminal processing protease
MSRWNLAWLVGLPCVVVLGLLVSHQAPSREKEPDYELVRLVVEVLAEVDKNYVRDLTPEQKRKLVEDMINGGLEKLDPYSGYFNAAEFKQFTRNSEGNFGGIGIQLGIDRLTGALQVISPMVGTPAYEAGVLAGDLIVKIDGKTTENMRMNDAVEMIQGEPGKPITLTVLHEGSKEPIDLPMKRGKIEIHTVLGESRKPDDPKSWNYWIDRDRKIGYVRLVQFNEDTAKHLREAITQLEQEGMTGLVLDLRDNPGGLLSSAVEVSDMFLTQGPIVSTKDRHGEGKTYEAHASGTLLEPAGAHPMAVLVNKNSASASEIVSAALQDHKRAVVVGERSFGKGSVQNIIRLPREDSDPRAALKLTTASYWRPSGRNIHRHPDSKETDDWGVRPDAGCEVALKDDERLQFLIARRNRDIVHGKPGSEPAKPKVDKVDKPEKPFTDRALDKAVEQIRASLDKANAAVPPPVIPPLKKAG